MQLSLASSSNEVSPPELVHIRCDVESLKHVGERALTVSQAVMG